MNHVYLPTSIQIDWWWLSFDKRRNCIANGTSNNLRKNLLGMISEDTYLVQLCSLNWNMYRLKIIFRDCQTLMQSFKLINLINIDGTG